MSNRTETKGQSMTTVNPEQQVNPDQLAETILNGNTATESDALALLATPYAELFGLVHAGSRLRREHFGMTIKLNYVVNLKSGMCPESCTYCSWPTRSSSATASPPRAKPPTTTSP